MYLPGLRKSDRFFEVAWAVSVAFARVGYVSQKNAANIEENSLFLVFRFFFFTFAPSEIF